MHNEVPNISGDFPLAGERIGPAWRDAWRKLNRVTWTNGGDLAFEIAPIHGIEVGTLKNILAAARRAGLLEVAYIKPEGRKRASAHYRIKES